MSDENSVERPMLIISEDKMPISAYQAIYHKLTSKVEVITETFNDAYQIKIDDISHLHNILHQSIAQYSIKGKKEEISISFYNDQSFTFSSYEKFLRHNYSNARCTAKIVYELDFFIILPVEIKEAEDIVQRFKVSIMMDQDFIEDDDHSVPIFMRHMMTGRNINVKIEYSDYSVARTIQSGIKDWIDMLPTKFKSSSRKWLERQSDFAIFFVPQFFAFGGLVAYSNFMKSDLISSYDNFPKLIVAAMAIVIISNIIGKLLITNFFRTLTINKFMTFIIITEGDQRRLLEINEKLKIRNVISSFILVTIVGGVLASLISSYIFLLFLAS